MKANFYRYLNGRESSGSWLCYKFGVPLFETCGSKDITLVETSAVQTFT